MTATREGGQPGTFELLRTFDQLKQLSSLHPESYAPAAVIGPNGVDSIARVGVRPLYVQDIEGLEERFFVRGHETTPELVQELLSDRLDVTNVRLAERILDGLLPMLLLPCRDAVSGSASDSPVPTDGAVHLTRRPDDVWMLAVRLTQVALWLLEAAQRDIGAGEVLPRARETLFLLATAPLRVSMATAVAPHGHARNSVKLTRIASYVTVWRAANTAGAGPSPAATPAQRYGRAAWQARAAWLACLDTYESHPSLVADGPTRLDERLAWLVFPAGREDGPRVRGTLQAMLSDRLLLLAASNPPPVATTATRDRAAVTEQPVDDGVPPALEVSRQERLRIQEEQLHLHLASDHLLPRYLLDEGFGLLLRLISDRQPNSTRRFLARWVPNLVLLLPFFVGVLALLAAVVLGTATLIAPIFGGDLALLSGPAGLTALHLTTRAAAVAWVAALVVTLWLGGRAGSYLGLLRIPAATAFGLAIAASLGTGWVVASQGAAGGLPLLLIVLALGYLLIEVVNQGAERGPVVTQRVMLVGVIGLGIATLVSVLVLWLIAPVFLADVELATTTTGVVRVLLTGASVAFALGVFLQAIWDESPVTAPLSRVRLR